VHFATRHSGPRPSAAVAHLGRRRHHPVADGRIGIRHPRNGPLVEAIGDPGLATDPRFADQRSRLRNNDDLAARIYAWAAGVTKREAYDRADATRAPIAPVNTVADLLASPHLRARNFFARIDHPLAGAYDYPGAPARMSSTPPSQRRAPLLGEHNHEVLCDMLGIPPRDLTALSAAGVI
jgi:formyl-CoA transferase